MVETPREPAVREALPNGFTRALLGACITPRHQELIIFPTEKCNFRCTYCYEDFVLPKMSETTQVAIERFLARRIPRLETFNFSWFGGEPLLASDVVLRLSRTAKALCDKHGVKLSGATTTNAYVLDQSLARALIECSQDFFQISLDGWREQHDRTRRRADGRGTFDVIWANLLAMKELPHRFKVMLRIHVHHENLESLEHLMVELARAFAGDDRYALDFQHLRNMGGEGGKSISRPISLSELGAHERRLRAICTAAARQVQGLPPETTQPVVASETVTQTAEPTFRAESATGANSGAEGEPYVCYAARPNSILIRSNGRLGKCTVALDDARNDIGYIADDGSVVVNNDKLAPWFRGLESLELMEAGCPLQKMAKGELPSPYPGGRLAIPIKVVPATKAQTASLYRKIAGRPINNQEEA